MANAGTITILCGFCKKSTQTAQSDDAHSYMNNTWNQNPFPFSEQQPQKSSDTIKWIFSHSIQQTRNHTSLTAPSQTDSTGWPPLPSALCQELWRAFAHSQRLAHVSCQSILKKAGCVFSWWLCAIACVIVVSCCLCYCRLLLVVCSWLCALSLLAPHLDCSTPQHQFQSFSLM